LVVNLKKDFGRTIFLTHQREREKETWNGSMQDIVARTSLYKKV